MFISLIVTVGFMSGMSIPKGCNALDKVPSSAEIIHTHGVDIAVYPSRKLPHPFTGCQYVWMDDADDMKTMVKLSIASFKDHKIQWFVGQEPDDPPIKCIYEDSKLVLAKSKNSKMCPSASSLEE